KYSSRRRASNLGSLHRVCVPHPWLRRWSDEVLVRYRAGGGHGHHSSNGRQPARSGFGTAEEKRSRRLEGDHSANCGGFGWGAWRGAEGRIRGLVRLSGPGASPVGGGG